MSAAEKDPVVVDGDAVPLLRNRWPGCKLPTSTAEAFGRDPRRQVAITGVPLPGPEHRPAVPPPSEVRDRRGRLIGKRRLQEGRK